MPHCAGDAAGLGRCCRWLQPREGTLLLLQLKQNVMPENGAAAEIERHGMLLVLLRWPWVGRGSGC